MPANLKQGAGRAARGTHPTKRAQRAATDGELLAFAVELGNAAPVNEWPAKELADVRRRLQRLFDVTARPRLIARNAADSTPEAIEALRQQTQIVLGQFLTDDLALAYVSADDLKSGGLVLNVVRDATGQGTVGAIRGPLPKVYELSLAFLLTSETGSRLRRCVDDKCARFFIRTGRQEACSERCMNRIYMRSYVPRKGKTTKRRKGKR